MDSLQANYNDEEGEEEDVLNNFPTPNTTDAIQSSSHSPAPAILTRIDDIVPAESVPENNTGSPNACVPPNDIKPEPESTPSGSISEDDPTVSSDTQNSPKRKKISSQEEDGLEGEDEFEEDMPPKKQKQLSSLTTILPTQPVDEGLQLQKQPPVSSVTTKAVTKATTAKKSKKKNNNVWVTKTTRKGKKKNKTNTQTPASAEEKVLITPVPRFSDKGDDTPDMKICLSKVYKAEKVEVSEDRLSAGSTKGYRMVRATRGVVEGAWYFEIKVVKLGETGHTRLGWSTDKGDLQAPIGYDGNSFGYRDIDGSKIHKALREKYGEEGYREGDVIGFYINLPEGGLYIPKPPQLVWYKGQRYICAPDLKEDPPKLVPGSEISFFRNGVCQGTAFKDLYGGRYYPAASMYTLPNQPNCTVKFNFGPDFECFPEDFGGRPIPNPMIKVPYHGGDSQVEDDNVASDKKQLP